MLDDFSITTVDSDLTIRALLKQLSTVTKDSHVFIDLQGPRLGRHGSISILSILIDGTSTVHLVDVHRLGSAAFDTVDHNQTSLRAILGSRLIIKVFFDVRSGCDALFSLFAVELAAVQDLQLMELALRRGSRQLLAERETCLFEAAVFSRAQEEGWQHSKDIGHEFDAKHGGRYAVLNERPFRPELTQYCAHNLMVLLRLHKLYTSRLQAPNESFWRQEIGKATADRLLLARAPAYDVYAADRAQGPWDEEYIERAIGAWNDDILTEALNGEEGIYDDPFNEYDDGEFDDDPYPDTARDCIGWEEDMAMRGSPF